MKVVYTTTVLELIAAVCKLVKPSAPNKYGFDEKTAEQKEVAYWPDGLQTLVRAEAKSNGKVKEREDALTKHYAARWTTAESVVLPTHLDVKFNVYKSFKSRDEMLVWGRTAHIKIPAKCVKAGELDGTEILTRVKHTFTRRDVTFHLEYTRKGAPTAHCRVAAQVYNTVVCDLH